MDWITIGQIAATAAIFMVHFVPIRYFFTQSISTPNGVDKFMCVFLPAMLAPISAFLEGLVLMGLIHLGMYVASWGVGNFLCSVGAVGVIISAPYAVKPLAMRAFVAVPHYVQKFFAECKTYKQELEVKVPINRSIYDLIGDE